MEALAKSLAEVVIAPPAVHDKEGGEAGGEKKGTWRASF